ncbi:DUF1995 domain containing protein [Nitzschia inconspicua]|uniref:DUF1995 domain containing protein n=1 Tax=Nitzschia inconspicua TaxID=303405 RepID=A0A9K3KNA1_9STRA|nr:DUF1995 domain containing protein [Nitzschia inconspicua]
MLPSVGNGGFNQLRDQRRTKLVSCCSGEITFPVPADDDGVTRRLLIPNTYYIPGLPLRILSPQQLAQELRPHETRPDGTYLTCYSDRIQLTWLDRRFLLTVPLNDANVGIVRTVPSYAGALSGNEHNLAFPTLFHRNNEREDILRDVNHMAKHLLQCHSCDAYEGASLSQNEGASKSQNEGASKSQNEGACEPEDTILSQLFDIDLLSTKAATPTQQLLYWHHRLNHRSFSLLKSMANEGKLPRHLPSADHPRCAACEMATAHRKPWRNRRAPSGLRKAKQPGQCISIDQLKSPIPGLMGQMKGIPTTKRFNYATVFVDHYSDLSYLVLQETDTADETLAAKHSFEAFTRTQASTDEAKGYTSCTKLYPRTGSQRYMAEPKQSHAAAVKRIGRYLLGTRDKGISITPEMSKGLECYVDSDFCGNWDPNIAENEPMTSKSRYGYIVKLHGMPVYWASKLHTIVTLSTAESEYIALSHAARYVRGTVYLLQEISDIYHKLQHDPQVKCRLFEDNSAAYKMAKVPKMRPRTRHINVAYHHFRGEVANGRLIPCKCATQDMEADIFTKATGKETLQTLRKRIMGWFRIQAPVVDEPAGKCSSQILSAPDCCGFFVQESKTAAKNDIAAILFPGVDQLDKMQDLDAMVGDRPLLLFNKQFQRPVDFGFLKNEQSRKEIFDRYAQGFAFQEFACRGEDTKLTFEYPNWTAAVICEGVEPDGSDREILLFEEQPNRPTYEELERKINEVLPQPLWMRKMEEAEAKGFKFQR